ncbi:GPP34 family phosphoprotein [Streptomyces justiciae]|uniref:GPP34 family phosphoprotein n=1 Tax=Streptomyces justiciae TaxID=2780140 RepID=A0ABU3LQW3_9ACTN|nr:GPP34 family phosphoprotein [Streptomyces justiciae]MDT7841605.1 GPP34 family phosphoprotein [Streptomyces justiciae]
MNTARDLAIVALEASPGRSVEQGDLSLALAASELLDLVEAGALGLDGDRVVPGAQSAPVDPLLTEAAATAVRQEPYESVEDWLWRRGRGLSSAYDSALEQEGLTARPRGLRIARRAGHAELVESPERRRAEERRASGEPVFAALAAAAGVQDEPAGDPADLSDDTVTTVLAAVGDAVMELEAVRQRRAIENAAFDNIWRGGV